MNRDLRAALIAARVAALIAGVAVCQPQQARAEPDRIEAAGLVKIPGGTFAMGSPEAERLNEEGLQHKVTVGAFYMGKHEVTQREWREVMGNNPSEFKADNLPVENVSWYDAVEYCNKRSEREGLSPAYTISGTDVRWNRNANGYRLPTEAEWEYACRAGTKTPFNTGNSITTNQANYDGERTVNVGKFAPNRWGLYDMHGNVWEWCWDWFGDYTSGSETNPAGPAAGPFRINRGGGWGHSPRHLRSAVRGGGAPSSRSADVGFRLVRNAQ
jgi:formylglycine-generating enzyme required for sulfatase activity